MKCLQCLAQRVQQDLLWEWNCNPSSVRSKHWFLRAETDWAVPVFVPHCTATSMVRAVRTPTPLQPSSRESDAHIRAVVRKKCSFRCARRGQFAASVEARLSKLLPLSTWSHVETAFWDHFAQAPRALTFWSGLSKRHLHFLKHACWTLNQHTLQRASKATALFIEKFRTVIKSWFWFSCLPNTHAWNFQHLVVY